MAKQLPTFVVDSREQLAWGFEPDVAITVRRALPTGDYSLDGHEWDVAIDRKMLDDFIGSVIQDWQRFRAVCRRLAGFQFGCIAVEATVNDVLERKYKADVHPNAVLGKAHSLWLDFGVPVFWWDNRAVARHMAERFLLLAHKRLTVPEMEEGIRGAG